MASQHSEQVVPPLSSCLHDTTRKMLPGIFVLVFVMAGTVVLVYSLPEHQPVPSSFVTGVAIIFGVLFTLMLIGNFLLYARMRMSLIRSASSSERSIRIEGQREAWLVRFRNFLEELEDRPRRFIRDYALRNALTKNSGKKSVGVVNESRELSMVPSSQSEVRCRDLDPIPGPIISVDRTRDEPDLERGEHPGQQTSTRYLGTASLRVAEATRTRTAPTDSVANKNPTDISHGPRNQEHGFADSSNIPGISTNTRDESLLGVYQDASQGRSPLAEIRKSKTKRGRTRQLVPPEKWLTEQHSILSMEHEEYRGSRGPASYKVDSMISSEPSGKVNTAHHSTYLMHKGERSSNTQVFHLDLPQQQNPYADLNSPSAYGTSKIGDSVAHLDWIKPSPRGSQDACHSDSDYITIDFHEISISNTSPCAASMQRSGNTKDLGIMGSYKNDVSLGHTTLADDSDTFKSSTKTYSQGPSIASSSSLEMAPKLPETERGSGASGFTSRFMENLTNLFDAEDERYEAHPTTAMPRRELRDGKRQPSEQAPQKGQPALGADG
jgi:hypothetical protein